MYMCVRAHLFIYLLFFYLVYLVVGSSSEYRVMSPVYAGSHFPTTESHGREKQTNKQNKTGKWVAGGGGGCGLGIPEFKV